MRLNDLKNDHTVFEKHLQAELSNFLIFVSIPENERSEPTMRMLDSFSDIYKVGADLQISAVHKRAMNSPAITGISVKGGPLGEFLQEPQSEGFSRFMRGIGDEEPSIFYKRLVNGEWYVGRVDLTYTRDFLERVSRLAGAPFMFISPDGFILITTNPELYLYSLPLGGTLQDGVISLPRLEAAGKGWLPIIATTPQVSIATLIPTNFLDSLRNTLGGFTLIFLFCFMLLSLFKLRQINRFLLEPLHLFSQKLSAIERGSYEEVNWTYPSNFEELRTLQEQFSAMSQAILQREQNLRQSESKLRDVLEFLPVPVMLFLPGGRILGLNAAFTVCYGYTREELPTVERWQELTFPEPQEREQAAQAWGEDVALASSCGRVTPVRMLRISARDRRVQEVELCMYSVAGVNIAVLRDITEQEHSRAAQRELTEQLHHSQKMDAIGQLAGGVAHDFNNMLSAITGTAELLMHDDPGGGMRREYLEIILKAATRAADLTQKLLSFARKGKKASTVINVLNVLKDSVAILARTTDKRVAITINNLADTYSVVGDSSQLQNVFINMGINSCHAMPEGGNLTFTLRNTTLDAIFCGHSQFAIEPGKYLEIEVQDSGFGMSPQVRNRIFEPFFTTREPGKGTGLGLAAVYGTVQDHHGAITVYSEVGAGTSFHIYLPLTEDGEEVSTPDEAHPLPDSGLALLIDDEDIIRVTAKAMLESFGFEVLTADGGEQGLEIFSARHGDISFVILDMVMPIMGGREVFARLRAIDPRPPVIISSGFSKNEDLAQMQDEGLAGFIRKPFRLADLSRAISNALRDREDG